MSFSTGGIKKQISVRGCGGDETIRWERKKIYSSGQRKASGFVILNRILQVSAYQALRSLLPTGR